EGLLRERWSVDQIASPLRPTDRKDLSISGRSTLGPPTVFLFWIEHLWVLCRRPSQTDQGVERFAAPMKTAD
ncbi:MAG: hypothetical protein AAF526_09090, partial [Pseudomonadota bacterium]